MNVWLQVLLGFAMFGCMVWWSLAKSDEPFRLIARWAVTFLMVGAMFKFAVPLITQETMGRAGAIAAALIIAACATVIGLTWATSWTHIALSPLTSAFDGGDEAPEHKAFYSSAETKRKRGQFHEAINDIQQQLERFPNDYHGLFLLAEIQAENLHDLPAAQQAIDEICVAHEKSHSHVSAALIAMADWCIKNGQIENARANLRKIEVLCPNTSFSQLAAQRIAHLESTERTLEERSRVIAVPVRENKYVIPKAAEMINADSDPNTIAADYVAHLQEHPLDIETRQKLAVLYANDFQRLDLAQLEFEHLIGIPNQSAKQVAQHLNLLADWQVKFGQADAATATLRRIMEAFPRTALAEAAQTRIVRLGSELRGQQKSQASVKLGSYKKDLGLNGDY